MLSRVRSCVSVLVVLIYSTFAAQADAAALTFVLDPSESELSLDGDIEGVVFFEPQAPGSLTTALTGVLEVDLTGSSIEFLPGSNVAAADQAGPFIPIAAAAAFAGQVIDIAPGISAFGAVSDFSFMAVGPARTIDGRVRNVRCR